MNKSILLIGIIISILCACSQPTQEGDVQRSTSQSSSENPIGTEFDSKNPGLTPNRTTDQSFTRNPTVTTIPTSAPTLTALPTDTPIPLPGLPSERTVITVNNINQLKPLLEFNVDHQINQVAWSSYSGEFALGMMGAVFIYNPEKMQRTNYLDTSADLLTFSPTQPLLAIGPSSFTIWNTSTRDQIHLQQEGSPSGQMMYSAAFSPDGNVLVTSAEGGLIELWDTNSWTKISNMSYPKIPGGGNDVFHLIFTPDGKYLLSQIYHSIVFWDAATGELLNDTLSTSAIAQDIDLSNTGRYLALVSESIISVWDISKGGQKIPVPYTKKLEFEGYSIFNESTMQIEFGHQDDILFAGSYNGDLGAWSLNPPREIFLEKGYLFSVDYLALSPDGRTLLTASFDGTVILWGVNP